MKSAADICIYEITAIALIRLLRQMKGSFINVYCL